MVVYLGVYYYRFVAYRRLGDLTSRKADAVDDSVKLLCSSSKDATARGPMGKPIGPEVLGKVGGAVIPDALWQMHNPRVCMCLMERALTRIH